VVNGFQSGGIDPLGESGSYPDFEDAPNDADNNTDKAVGGRLEFKLGGIFDFGVSAYSGAYSDEGDPSARIFMLGTDAQLRPTPTTTLRAGYALMNVDLPTAVTRQSYLRGGLYGELSQRFARS